MFNSFRERLEVFCDDFAKVNGAIKSGASLSGDLFLGILARRPNEDEATLRFRCWSTLNAYSYVLGNISALRNAGFVRVREGQEEMEGALLLALCLHLATNESQLDNKPSLESIIDTALNASEMTEPPNQ